MASDARIVLCRNPSALLIADARSPGRGEGGREGGRGKKRRGDNRNENLQNYNKPSESKMFALFFLSASTYQQTNDYLHRTGTYAHLSIHCF